MNCPTCQAALPEDAAFCGHCGGALRSERTCARCGRSNSPEMRFCLGCGAALSPDSPAQAPRTYTPKHLAEKILTSRSAIEGERKQVTVLFADVKGSMDLATNGRCRHNLGYRTPILQTLRRRLYGPLWTGPETARSGGEEMPC